MNDHATLTGRNLEPWRASLAVALWLDEHGVPGLWQRMESLSVAYQSERPDLEASDLTALVVLALAAACAPGPCSGAPGPTGMAGAGGTGNLEGEPAHWILETSEVTAAAKKIAVETESTLSPDQIDTRRVGMVLNKMRIKKPPRPGGKGRRKWEVSPADLQRWSLAYGIPLPEQLRARDEPSSPQVGTVGEVGPVGTWEEGEL